MDASIQLALSISVPTLAVLVGILINNSRLGDVNDRIGDLRGEMNSRFDAMDRRMDQRFEDMKAMWRSELHRVEEVLDARLKHLEER
jgi:hypothetical protein